MYSTRASYLGDWLVKNQGELALGNVKKKYLRPKKKLQRFKESPSANKQSSTRQYGKTKGQVDIPLLCLT
jgi:hypothetical protein